MKANLVLNLIIIALMFVLFFSVLFSSPASAETAITVNGHDTWEGAYEEFRKQWEKSNG